MCHGQIIGDALLRARKEHRCSECGRPIRPGRIYRRYRWVEGRDDPNTVKLCERCQALLDRRLGEDGEACYYLGEARRDLRENEGERGGWWRELRAKLREAITRNRERYGKA